MASPAEREPQLPLLMRAINGYEASSPEIPLFCSDSSHGLYPQSPQVRLTEARVPAEINSSVYNYNSYPLTPSHPITPTHRLPSLRFGIQSSGDGYSNYFKRETMAGFETPLDSGRSSALFFGANTTPNGQHADLASPQVGKVERVTLSGKRQAVARRITAVWDDVDKRIYDLKNHGCTNRQVADKIKRLGVDYDPKTIGTRYLRLKAHASSVEKQGEDPLHEWTRQEDVAIFKAYQTAAAMQLERIARAKAKFWPDCYEQALRLLPDTDTTGITKDACQHRHSVLSADSFAEYRAEITSTIPATENGNHGDSEHQAPFPANGLHSSPTNAVHQMDEDDSPCPRFERSSRVNVFADPRSRMLTTELDRELKVRKLSRVGKKKELLLRLREDDEKSSMETLQSRLRARNLSTEGTKSDLINRIVESDINSCEWGKRVAEVTLEEAHPHTVPPHVQRGADAETRKRSHPSLDDERPFKRQIPTGTQLHMAAQPSKPGVVEGGARVIPGPA